jgi:peptide/nickel transport system permease protein
MRSRSAQVVWWLSAGWLFVVTAHAVAYRALPWVRRYDERVGNGADAFRQAPSWSNWFGTDKLGRDVFSRCVYGARTTLLIAVAAIAVGIVVATSMAMIAGYRRGRTDTIVSTATDLMVAVPPVVFLFTLTAFFDERELLGFTFTRKWLVVFGLAFVAVAPLVRVLRSAAMVEASLDYVAAARVAGSSTPRLLRRELLPNLMPAVVTVAFTGLGLLVVAESALAFLGQSVPAPEPTWGKLIADGRSDLDTLPYLSLLPALVLFLTVLACNVIGDHLADRFRSGRT